MENLKGKPKQLNEVTKARNLPAKWFVNLHSEAYRSNPPQPILYHMTALVA